MHLWWKLLGLLRKEVRKFKARETSHSIKARRGTGVLLLAEHCFVPGSVSSTRGKSRLWIERVRGTWRGTRGRNG